MIRFEQVCKKYPNGYEALVDISFEINRGEMVFVTGHSGAGKSTLLKLIMLMERPSRGQILVAAQNLGRITRQQIPYYRRNIGVVFQNHRLLFDRPVFHNVALPLEVSAANPEDIGRRVRAALDKVGLLNKEKSMPAFLSEGEQQRVGIARAIVNRPALLLADEPTGNLDEQLSTGIMDLFREFNQVGVTVLVATHDVGQVQRLQCRELALQQGRLAGVTSA